MPQILTTVMLMLTVPTRKDHSTAHVTMVTQEKESRVLVNKHSMEHYVDQESKSLIPNIITISNL